MDYRNKTRSLTETAILISMLIVIEALTIYMPFFSIIGILILPIITAMIYLKQDIKKFLMAIIVAFIVTILIADIVTALNLFFMYSFPGIVLGYVVENKKNFSKSMFLLTLAFVVSFVFSFMLLVKLGMNSSVSDVIDKFINTNHEAFNMVISKYKDMGMTKEQLKLIENYKNMFTKENVQKSLPGALTMASFFITFFTYKISISIFRKLKMKVPSTREFSTWYIDDRITALIIGVICLGIILSSKGVLIGEYIFNTSFIIGRFIIEVIGISTLVYFLKNKYELSRGIMITIIIISFLLKMDIIYFFLGIAESIMDARGLYKRKLN